MPIHIFYFPNADIPVSILHILLLHTPFGTSTRMLYLFNGLINKGNTHTSMLALTHECFVDVFYFLSMINLFLFCILLYIYRR